MTSAPYLSVVLAARNDDHGGNMLGRMQACLDSWIFQARELGLDSEIVVVEWNPPAERARLADALRWPADPGPVAVRFLEVSAERHRSLPNAAAIPLHQMIAKNVGIRRARGQFILATNLDIIFSSELMRWLADRKLESGAMYRMDRHDIASDIPSGAAVEELLDFARHNVRRLFARNGVFHLSPDNRRRREPLDVLGEASEIHFGSGWFGVESNSSEPFRWLEDEARLFLDECPPDTCELLLDVETGPSAGGKPVRLSFHDRDGRELAAADVEGRRVLTLTVQRSACPVELVARVQGANVPLTRDMRLLNLRLFRAEWQGRGDCYSTAALDTAGPRVISPRHIGARDLDLDITPGGDRSLESLTIRLSDRFGRVLFDSTVRRDEVEREEGSGSRYFLRLRVKTSSALEAADQPWSLRVGESKPVAEWDRAFEAPSPVPHQIHRAAFLHTNACGDFTLLHRDDWHDLRGYVEAPIWPMHVDSLFCNTAFHAGLNEVVLADPLRIYHVEHFSGAGWTPEGEDELNLRVARKAVTVIPHNSVVEWMDRMRRFNAPMIFTLPGWGMADLELPEREIPGRG